MNHHRNNKYNPGIHRRRSIRLPEFDYAANGAYLITICTYHRRMLFKNDQIKRIVEGAWRATGDIRDDVIIDEFVVMPNHLHGIVVISHPLTQPGGSEDMRDIGKSLAAPPQGVCDTPLRAHRKGKFKSPSQTIGAIVRGFKSSTTGKIRRLMKRPDLHVWQRNYHEHVIRNDNDLYDARKYIRENPLNWDIDDYNPINIRPVET